MIKIEEFIKYIKYGWVAMDEDGSWCIYEDCPKLCEDMWTPCVEESGLIHLCGIYPVNDWKYSLIEVLDGKRV